MTHGSQGNHQAGSSQQLKQFLSVSEAAELLGTSAMTLYRSIKAGQFPAVKIRGRYLIPTKAIDALVEAAMSATRPVEAGEVDWR